MISYADARAFVLANCQLRPARLVDLDESLGCLLAEPVIATASVPSFANSAMDGYAVRSYDVEGASSSRPARLKVVGELPAGSAPTVEVGRGEAIRIMTGAPFPSGADGVAIVEKTETDGQDVLVFEPVSSGQHVRGAGEDIAAGDQVFAARTLLDPGHLGVLASVGLQRVPVHPRARVAVLSTGDELVAVGGHSGSALRPGQIYDSNRHTLLALLRQDGHQVLDLGIAPDDESDIRRRIEKGVAECDAVLTSGGVSMGDFDYVKMVLDDIGDMRWMQVAIRPAKPFAFGTVGATPVFGLPGNPVSSMVSYELFARPALRRMAGFPAEELDRPTIVAITDQALHRKPDGRVNYTRVRARFGTDGRCHVLPLGGQGSHQLRAMANADALAVVPAGEAIPAGGDVDVMLL